VARDALSVYLNPANPIADLSLTELRGIFSGTIVDWGEVGGLAGPIVPVVRPPASGTAQFFRDHVLAGTGFAPTARVMPRTADVVEVVTSNSGAVGFGGLVQGSELVHARLDGVAPTAATVRDGSYPLARYLYFYATAPPTGAVKSFTDWCVSPAGQQVVAEVGFIPPWTAPG
jgi:phosphate transport system substrate-binding protein